MRGQFPMLINLYNGKTKYFLKDAKNAENNLQIIFYNPALLRFYLKNIYSVSFSLL